MAALTRREDCASDLAFDAWLGGSIDPALGRALEVHVSRCARCRSRCEDLSAQRHYARLVRKGGRASNLAHGRELGVMLRSALANADTVCLGGYLSYAVDVSSYGARARLGVCTSQLENRSLRASVLAYDLGFDAYHTRDISKTAFEAGIGAGLSLFDQRFETRGLAPSRLSVAPFLGVGVGVQRQLPYGLYASLHVTGETHFLRVAQMSGAGQLVVGFVVRPLLGFGKRF